METVEAYLAYLKTKEKEYQAYLIAKEHLGTLFRIENTAGFIQFCARTF